jgi:flagellar biosynthesis regulator FlaF
MKEEAKRFAKLHYFHRAKRGQSQQTSSMPNYIHPSRYSIKGESLRGMENITNLQHGKQRQSEKVEAIRAAIQEQQEQLVFNVLELYDATSASSPTSSTASITRSVLRLNAAKLSKVYSGKTQEALAYSRRVAAEDAIVAAEILEQDFRPDVIDVTTGGIDYVRSTSSLCTFSVAY